MKKKRPGKQAQSIAKTLADNIAIYRKAAGWTQLQLSQMLNVDVESISRYEGGVFKPTFERVDELARLFGIPAWALFAKIDERKHVLALELSEQLMLLSDDDSSTLREIINVYIKSHGNT